MSKLLRHTRRARLAVAALVLLAAGRLAAESVYFVKLTDMKKETTCQVMSREDLAKAKTQVQDEARVFQQALAAVKKDWEADETNKGTPFPNGRLSPRKLQETGPLDPKVAEKKVASFEEAAMNDGPDFKGKRTRPTDREKEQAAKEAAKESAVTRACEKLDAKIQELLKPAAGGGSKPAAAHQP